MILEDVFAPIESGPLVVRLARSEAEILAAQKLRYRIFCEELGGKANAQVRAQKRDFDIYDDACFHVLVINRDLPAEQSVVGTYRLMTRDTIKNIGKFYTETEYDLGPLKTYPTPVLELGRSCVEQQYRTRPVLQLLWSGIGAFVVAKNIDVMFGCASLYGADASQHHYALSYLYHHHLAPEPVRPRALPDQYVKMDWLAKEAVSPREAIKLLPPLIKGYLRLGGHVGDGAVLDLAYNTTDVAIVVLTDQIKNSYLERFTPGSE